MTEPRTEAGRRLYDTLVVLNPDDAERVLLHAILHVEAEAAALGKAEAEHDARDAEAEREFRKPIR